MPELPNWLTWILAAATFASLVINILQWQKAQDRNHALRQLLPTWFSWAEEIRMQTSESRLNSDMNNPVRLGVAVNIIGNAHGHARKLARDIDRVADYYRSAEELAEKRALENRRRRQAQRRKRESREITP